MPKILKTNQRQVKIRQELQREILTLGEFIQSLQNTFFKLKANPADTNEIQILFDTYANLQNNVNLLEKKLLVFENFCSSKHKFSDD